MITSTEIFGLLSVCSWLCAQIPQCYKNYRLKTIEGLSLEFIISWLIGDLLNVVGCIFSNQLRFQLILSIWFVFVDIILTNQYISYKDTQDERGRPVTRMLTHRQTVSLSINRVATRPPLTNQRAKRSQTHSVQRTEGSTSRSRSIASLLILTMTLGVSAAPTITPLQDNSDISATVGKLSSWACVTFYLSSRMPQIYYNYQRKSVEGLSVYLFIFALLGNSFYTLSIITSPQLHQSRPLAVEYLMKSLPFLIGSFGTILFDIIIISQVIIYKNNYSSEERQPLL